MANLLRWRPALRAWHRWFGLGAALWLLLLALTGSVIAFYDELDRALNPDWRGVPVAGPAPSVPVDAALITVAAALPGFSPRMVDLPEQAGHTITMIGSMARDGEDVPAQAFIDAEGRTVLGWRQMGVLALDRRHLMDTIYGLHVELLLGEMAAWLLGLLALLWMLDHLAALLLSFPNRARWREAFLIKGRGFSLRWLFDLHRASGLWLYPLTFILALTGLTLTWHEETRWVARWAAPVSERLHVSMPQRPAPANPISADQALAKVAAATQSSADSLVLLPRQGVYGVRSFDARDLDGMGRLWTYVDMANGRIVGQRHDNGEGPGDAFFAWQYPLHSGKILGLSGRIIVAVAGLATAGLCLTGVFLWAKRRRRAVSASPL